MDMIFSDTFFSLLKKIIIVLLLLPTVLVAFGFKIKSLNNIAVYLLITGIILAIILTFDHLITISFY